MIRGGCHGTNAPMRAATAGVGVVSSSMQPYQSVPASILLGRCSKPERKALPVPVIQRCLSRTCSSRSGPRQGPPTTMPATKRALKHDTQIRSCVLLDRSNKPRTRTRNSTNEPSNIATPLNRHTRAILPCQRHIQKCTLTIGNNRFSDRFCDTSISDQHSRSCAVPHLMQ